MPVCPGCKQEFPRRKNGACPGCGIPVRIRDGQWYSLTEGAPNIRLLEYWEKCIAERLNSPFSIPRKSERYKREAKFAQDLLAEAGYDIDLALQGIWVIFNDKHFSFKLPTTLLFIRHDWLAALTIARRILKERRKQEELDRKRYEEYKEMEDLWT